MGPNQAIHELVRFSRVASDAVGAEDVAEALVEAASRAVPIAAACVIGVDDEADPILLHAQGIPAGEVKLQGLLESHPKTLFRSIDSVGAAYGYPLLSGGGLFGTMVLGLEPGEAVSDVEHELLTGLAEVAALSMDRAVRTSELRETIRALEASREELARTETLRSLGQMAAIVAHEVKNPIASISGVMQVFRNRSAEDSNDRKVFQRVIDRLGDLNRMLTELLSFSRPRAPEKMDLSLKGAMDSVAEGFASSHDTEDVELVFDGSDVTVPADPAMLQQVLLNLVLNAAQAMKDEGRVDVSWQVDGGFVQIDVRDHGPGLPEHVRTTLFQPFVTTKTRGTGLGLAVCKRICEAHGGSIEANNGDDQGAVFTIRLPL